MFIIPIQPMKQMVFTQGALSAETKRENTSFQSALDTAINALSETQSRARQDAYLLASGNVDNIAEIMINTLKAETMVQTATQITTRVINAYKEIINIQI